MEDEKSALLEQADRCRRQAQAIDVEDASAKLTTMAQDYEAQAGRLAASRRPLVQSVLWRQLAKVTRQAPIYSMGHRFPAWIHRRAATVTAACGVALSRTMAALATDRSDMFSMMAAALRSRCKFAS